jgi:predicted amidohydrolase
MLADVQSRRIALAQIAPRLGSLEVNLATHHDLLAKARDAGADLVVFPELGLTGYQLQDLASEVAMRLDDPAAATLAGATRGLSAVVSFVEESADHRLFIAAALLEDGEIRHVHRKLYLPTYGLFDERRFFAAGDVLRSVPSRLGIGSGIGVCEDFWHLSVPQLLALDGAQILINVSSSPGRDLAADQRGRSRDRDLVADADADLRPADDVVRDLLQPGRRRRIDLVLGRLRGHRPERAGHLQRPALRRRAVHGRCPDRRHPARADRLAAAARRTAGAAGA